MVEEQQNKQMDALLTNNDEYNTANILQLRLNTEPILHNIELYLKGQYEQYVQDGEGNVSLQHTDYSDPKCNPQGIYTVMSWLRGTINSQIVQGNFEKHEDLYNYLATFRMTLAETLMINLTNYAIKETDWEGILDMIMSMMKPFMSRLVGNKERDSYTHTLQHTQRSDSVVANKSKFPFM
jgi:hypothetical protein